MLSGKSTAYWRSSRRVLTSTILHTAPSKSNIIAFYYAYIFLRQTYSIYVVCETGLIAEPVSYYYQNLVLISLQLLLLARPSASPNELNGEAHHEHSF